MKKEIEKTESFESFSQTMINHFSKEFNIPVEVLTMRFGRGWISYEEKLRKNLCDLYREKLRMMTVDVINCGLIDK